MLTQATMTIHTRPRPLCCTPSHECWLLAGERPHMLLPPPLPPPLHCSEFAFMAQQVCAPLHITSASPPCRGRPDR
jgi:hypothetical protein